MKKRIACLLLFSLALVACRGLPSRGPIDPSLAAFIPEDAVALVGVRIDQLRETPIYRKLDTEHRLPRFENFRTESGFDPARDMRELLVATNGVNTLAMARGVFRTRPAGDLTSTPYRGFTLFARDAREVMVFPDQNTVLGGAGAVVCSAIDRYKSGAHSAPPGLMERAQSIPDDAQVWAVVSGWRGLTPETLREMGNAGNLDRVLRSVEDATLTVNLHSGLHAAAVGECRSEALATSLSEQLRGLAGALRIGVPENRPDLTRALNGIRVTQDSRTVKVKIDIAPDVAEKLLQQ